jgi:tetratricopeptide (TPR) repeat protein
LAYRTVLAMAPGDPDAVRGLARVAGETSTKRDETGAARSVTTFSTYTLPPAGAVSMLPSGATTTREKERESLPDGQEKAWELLRAGRYTEAYDTFEAQLRIDPADTRSLVGLGLSAEARQVPAAAQIAYRTVLERSPDDVEAAQGLERIGGLRS